MTKPYLITLLPGDGVGPEVNAQGRKVLAAAARRFGFAIDFQVGDFGLVAAKKYGSGFPRETLELCRASDAILTGATGGVTGSGAYKTIDPEDGKRGLHHSLELTVNLRPARLYAGLEACSVLRPALIGQGIDMVILRDISAGLKHGKPRGLTGSGSARKAINTITYTEAEVARIMRASFRLARQRRRRLDVISQDNSLETSQLWRQVAIEMGKDHPDVHLEHHYPDAFGRLLLVQPGAFDVVIVHDNYLAGVFNDQSGAIVGSLGMIPSADLRVPDSGALDDCFGFYEPAHGSVPHRAGKDQVNPLGTILAAALLLQHSLGQSAAAAAVDRAVTAVLQQYRTYDIAVPGTTLVGTAEMGDRVAQAVADS